MIHVAYTINVAGLGAVQFVDQLVASLYSLRQTATKESPVTAHVLFANIPTDLLLRILALRAPDFDLDARRIPKPDMDVLQGMSRYQANSAAREWSGIVYARLFLHKFLPAVERCIYLDADTLVRAPLAELWKTDLGGKPIGVAMGGTPEYGFNTGVMLIDLAALRAIPDHDGRLMAFMSANSRTFMLPDQTTVNRFYAGQLHELPGEWNYPPRPGANDPALWTAKIWHFYAACAKPRRIAADDVGRALLEWNAKLETACREAVQ